MYLFIKLIKKYGLNVFEFVLNLFFITPPPPPFFFSFFFSILFYPSPFPHYRLCSAAPLASGPTPDAGVAGSKSISK